jgi:hypothetical protein
MKAYKRYSVYPPHVWVPALLAAYVSFFFWWKSDLLSAWVGPGLFFAVMLTGTLADLFGRNRRVRRASIRLVVLLALLWPILLAAWMRR